MQRKSFPGKKLVIIFRPIYSLHVIQFSICRYTQYFILDVLLDWLLWLLNVWLSSDMIINILMTVLFGWPFQVLSWFDFPPIFLTVSCAFLFSIVCSFVGLVMQILVDKFHCKLPKKGYSNSPVVVVV